MKITIRRNRKPNPKAGENPWVPNGATNAFVAEGEGLEKAGIGANWDVALGNLVRANYRALGVEQVDIVDPIAAEPHIRYIPGEGPAFEVVNEETQS